MVDPRYYASTVWRSALERPVGPQLPTTTDPHWGGGSELPTMANEEEANQGSPLSSRLALPSCLGESSFWFKERQDRDKDRSQVASANCRKDYADECSWL